MAQRECPACALESDTAETVCPFCGYEFPEPSKGLSAAAWLFIFLLIGLPLWWLIDRLF